MIEIVIHGRGGGGGVTLAKLIAGTYFLRGKYVQAFGVYGAERTGAPLQAFVRVDSKEITAHVPVVAADHVVVIDPSLITPAIVAGMKTDGWLILNTGQAPGQFAELFPGRRVATIDASQIAVANRLGSKALPIVNTTMLGAVVKVLGLEFADVEAALVEAKFGGGNIDAARTAFERVRTQVISGAILPVTPSIAVLAPGFLDDGAGALPATLTGAWASRRPRTRELTAVCTNACPAGNDVRGFLRAVAGGNYTEALAIILRTSPFPGTCGRVCPAPCMTACNRRELDESVNIRDIERAVAERGVWPQAVQPTRRQRVAVVGSGPAGLSAAYHLARAGFPVTVFEAAAELGGVLRSGIPQYRLPRQILDREVDHILLHSVEAQTNHPVDRKELAQLRANFAAVFVATGLQKWNSLDLGDACNDAVSQGLDFLNGVARGEAALANGSVAVVGGGNTALDAARSALRLGAKEVRVIYRRSRTEMPAIAEEINEALQEGVAIDELMSPVRLREGTGGRVLVCQRMRLGDVDESGRRRPVPLEGDDAFVEVACDRLLLAVGQSPDLSVLPQNARISESRVVSQALDGMLIFAGGDLALGEGTVSAAIGSGRMAAARIAAALLGTELEQPTLPDLAGPDVVIYDRFPRTPQHRSATLPSAERRTSFAEVRLGIRDEQVDDAIRAEAERCLSCGACTACDTCVVYCPEAVLSSDGVGRLTFDYDYCKGCGLCATQCPRGVIIMESCSKEALP